MRTEGEYTAVPPQFYRSRERSQNSTIMLLTHDNGRAPSTPTPLSSERFSVQALEMYPLSVVFAPLTVRQLSVKHKSEGRGNALFNRTKKNISAEQARRFRSLLCFDYLIR